MENSIDFMKPPLRNELYGRYIGERSSWQPNFQSSGHGERSVTLALNRQRQWLRLPDQHAAVSKHLLSAIAQ